MLFLQRYLKIKDSSYRFPPDRHSTESDCSRFHDGIRSDYTSFLWNPLLEYKNSQTVVSAVYCIDYTRYHGSNKSVSGHNRFDLGIDAVQWSDAVTSVTQKVKLGFRDWPDTSSRAVVSAFVVVSWTLFYKHDLFIVRTWISNYTISLIWWSEIPPLSWNTCCCFLSFFFFFSVDIRSCVISPLIQ